MATVISIGNQKGGCGKTTTAVNLSAGLAINNNKVLLIDMDPQGNSSLTFGINIEDIPISMADILLDEGLELKYNIFTKGSIHIAPSNPSLNYAEERLHTMKDKTLRLKRKLADLDDYYDYIIIDCPPNIGVLTTNALMASHHIIIPVDVGYYSLVGIRQFLARIEDVKLTNPELEILGLIITLYTERNLLSQEVRAKLIENFGDKVFKSVIHRDVKLAEAPAHLLSAFEYAWNGRGSADYLALTKEVIKATKAVKVA